MIHQARPRRCAGGTNHVSEPIGRPLTILSLVRALLVVNPLATSTTAAGRDVLAHALASELKIEILHTRYRGHAAEATAKAAAAGTELVVALGGDGTVNEVVNGMLSGGVAAAPALAVVPGGSANVFARALGISRDPLEATAELLRALTAGRSRPVGLGRADDRWFTFNAGLGWDAAVVARVERARARGHEASSLRYAMTATAEYVRQLRRPPELSVELPGGPAGPDERLGQVRMALVCNTDPWTYAGSRPIRTNPGSTFETGLGLFALRDLWPSTVLPVVVEAFRNHGNPRGRRVLRRDGLPAVRVRSEVPVPHQVDGDHLGERSEVDFVAVPNALRVVV
jgi:diacylglycerol kinase family enzyme